MNPPIYIFECSIFSKYRNINYQSAPHKIVHAVVDMVKWKQGIKFSTVFLIVIEIEQF